MDKVKRLQLAIHLDEIEAARSDIQEHGADVRYLDYFFVHNFVQGRTIVIIIIIIIIITIIIIIIIG